MNEVSAKTFLITGVSSGFGLAFAEAALNDGHTVIGTVRNDDARERLQALAPGKAHAITRRDRFRRHSHGDNGG